MGSFDLEFGAHGDGDPKRVAPRTLVRIAVGPAMRAAIDTPTSGGHVEQPFNVAGWALDLGAGDGSGIDTVHVWAYPASGGEPIFLGVAAVGGGDRSDVAAVYGKQFSGSAFGLTVSSLEPGTYDIVVYPHRSSTKSFEGAQVVRITVD